MATLTDRLLEMIPRVITSIEMPEDEALSRVEARDDTLFADAWMAAYHRHSRFPDEVTEPCRKAAYFAAFAKWRSPDLAALISDDFGLFCQVALAGIDDTFVQGLAAVYFLEHRFPCEICSSDSSMAELIIRSGS